MPSSVEPSRIGIGFSCMDFSCRREAELEARPEDDDMRRVSRRDIVESGECRSFHVATAILEV